MGRYTGPKVRLSRRVGAPIADIPKHTGGELTLPGMHGYRGRRNTEYGVRLIEKQKLRYYYGMQEKQFRRFLDMAKKSKGNTAQTLVRAGSDLVQGFINGIQSKIGRLAEIAQELADTVAGGVKDFLGIRSPSKLMREVGNDTMDGFNLGLADRVPDLRSELQGIAGMVPSFALPNGQTLALPTPGSSSPTVQVFIGNERLDSHFDARIAQSNQSRDRLVTQGVRR